MQRLIPSPTRSAIALEDGFLAAWTEGDGGSGGPSRVGVKRTGARFSIGKPLKWNEATTDRRESASRRLTMLMFKMIDPQPPFVAYTERLSTRPAALAAQAQ